MTLSRQSSMLLLLLLTLVGGGAVVQSFLSPDLAPLAPVHPSIDRTPQVEALPPTDMERTSMADPGTERIADASGTTVIHPLEVELTQLETGSFDPRPGVQPPGSGASARLRGTIMGDRGDRTTGKVTFIAGPNQGRILRTDSDGHFGASDLYQGLSIVLVESDQGLKSEREVMLRQLITSTLEVSLSRKDACVVRGLVRDGKGEPVTRALVRMDAQETYSDELGEFFFPRVSPGKVLAIVSREGMASYREALYIPRGGAIKRDKLTFTLDPGVSLTLSVEALIGSAGPSTAYIFPIGGQRINSSRGQRTYPWHLVNPIEIPPGRSVTIQGLPPGHVSLMIFHPGAIASPPLLNKKLFEGRSNQHVFTLKKGLTLQGVVKMPDGSPAIGATVRLDAPDAGLATTKVMQQKFTYNLQMVLPHLPSGRQTVVTDKQGRFSLTLFSKVASGFYLTAQSADGTLEAAQSVGSGPAVVEISLVEPRRETARLEIGLAGRFQGLPVKVSVNGTPKDVILLAPGDPLVIEELDPGIWRADVWWNHDHIQQAYQFQLSANGSASLSVVLPKGALEGQTEAERRRAGK